MQSKIRQCRGSAFRSGLRTAAVVAIAAAGPVAPARAQPTEDLSKVKVEVTRLAGSVYLLESVGDAFGGGNVVVSAGPDGMLVVDTKVRGMADKLKAALAPLSPQPVRFVVNTHAHFDHVGNNAAFGDSATIIAHPGVRAAFLGAKTKPPEAALPRLTVTDKITLHMNGEQIDIVHPRTGHTSADVFVFFRNAKVVHLGDEYFAKMYPMIAGDGDPRGLIANLEQLVAELSPDYKIVPGHGSIATVNDLRATVAMLKESTAIVEAGIAAGKSLDQLKREKVLARLDATWGKGYLKMEQFIEMLHGGLTRQPRG